MPLLPFAALLVVLAACGGGDSTGPAPSGSMRFTYRGEVSGSAAGSFAVDGPRQQFVGGAAGAGATRLRAQGVGTYITVYGSRVDLAYAELEVTLYSATAPGTFPVCGPSDPEPRHCLLSGSFSPDPTSVHFFRSGTVTITELTPSRVRGTFEGVTVGYCSGCANPADEDTIAITGGAFDVPFR